MVLFLFRGPHPPIGGFPFIVGLQNHPNTCFSLTKTILPVPCSHPPIGGFPFKSPSKPTKNGFPHKKKHSSSSPPVLTQKSAKAVSLGCDAKTLRQEQWEAPGSALGRLARWLAESQAKARRAAGEARGEGCAEFEDLSLLAFKGVDVTMGPNLDIYALIVSGARRQMEEVRKESTGSKLRTCPPWPVIGRR